MYNQFLKELLEVFKDKKNLIISILLPILLIPTALVLVVLLSVMLSSNELQKIRHYQLLSELPDSLTKQLQQLPQYQQVDTTEDYQQAIQQGQLDFAIQFEDDQFTVFFNQADLYSPVRRLLEQYLADHHQQQQQALLTELALDPAIEAVLLNGVKVNWQGLVSDQQLTGKVMLSILPLMMLVMVCISAIATSADMLAGEKERQTIQTTWLAPVSTLEIIIGKWLAVSFFAALSALLTLLSLFAAVYILYRQLEFDILNVLIDVLSFKTLFVVYVLNLPNFLLISAFLVLSSAVAGNFKEAQSYGSVFMLLCTFPLGLFANVTLDMTWVLALIPMLNIQSWLQSYSTHLLSMHWWWLIILSYTCIVAGSLGLCRYIADRESMLFSR